MSGIVRRRGGGEGGGRRELVDGWPTRSESCSKSFFRNAIDVNVYLNMMKYAHVSWH